jgi:low temperature requirement protein LtrA
MSDPSPSTMEGTEPGKRVTWAELFFDLVFVFAITEVSSLLRVDHSWRGALRALIVFVPIYWVWVGTTVQSNVHDMTTPVRRLAVFGVALAGLFMALAVPEAFGDRALLLACAYWAGRLIIGLGLVVRSSAPRLNPFTISMVITGPLLIAGALVGGSTQEILWAAAGLIDLSTPTLFRPRMRGMHFDAPHLTERFGQFVLIALGESVVAIGGSAEAGGRLDLGVGCAVAATFAVTCGLWWVYFHFAADAMRHALTTAKVQLDVTRLVLSYGHLAFIGSIIAVSVGMREAVAEPGRHPSWAIAGLLFGGAAAFLATFGYTRWTMFRLVSWTRLVAAGIVLVLMVAAPHMPSLAATTMLALALGVLNLVELMRVEQIGWRALLSARTNDGGP